MEFRRSLFWGVDPKTIDLEKNARYVIERVLDDGTDAEVRWMFNNYGWRFIRDDFNHCAHNLTPKSRNFWDLMLNEYMPNTTASQTGSTRGSSIDNVENDPMPPLRFKTDWNTIKAYFKREVPSISKELLRIND